MTEDLPPPVAAYAAANARLDADGMLAAFAGDAVVQDEGARHQGREAIRAWIQTATIGVRAIFTPETWREDGGTVVVEGPVAGDFPGSPIRLTFRFAFVDDLIRRLEIA